MKQPDIQKITEKLIYIVFAAVFGVCAFCTLVHFPKYYLLFQHSTVKTVLFCIAAAVVILIWENILQGRVEKKYNLIRFLTALILLFVQVFLFLKIMSPIGWDVLEVVNSAEFGMYNGDYFVKHSNNLFLQILLSAYLKITAVFQLSALRKMELLNLFFADSAILAAVLTVKKIYGMKAADRIFMSAVLLIGFHPMLSVIYSDTMAMPFPIGTLFCLVYGMDADKVWKRAVFFFAGGVCAVVGYHIKPTVIIIDIAIFILAILHWKGSCFREGIAVPALAAILAAGISCGVIYVIEQPVKQELQEQYPDITARGWLYYAGLGLNTPTESSPGYGSYNEEETLWMQEHIEDSNYPQEAVEHLKNRLSEFGVIGYLEHLINKLIWAGSDGTFFYGGEGDFHLEAQSSQNTVRGKLQNGFYIETDFYQKWFSSWMQGVWLLICIRGIASCFGRNKNFYSAVAKLSMIGLFLFLLLFENRSRYLFLYLPVLLTAVETENNFIRLSCRSRHKLLS